MDEQGRKRICGKPEEPSMGLVGISNGPGEPGVKGDAKSTANDGVQGFSASNQNAGVLGVNTQAGAGVKGVSEQQDGVQGFAKHPDHFGVIGDNQAGVGVRGQSVGHDGVQGLSQQRSGVTGRGPTGGFFEGGGVAGVHAVGLGAGPAILAKQGGNNLVAFLDGKVTVTKTLTAFDVEIAGADCAELFDTASSTQIEPGTVMVIGDDGRLVKSRRAYDSRVAGIASGAGNLRPGITLGSGAGCDGKVSLALVGRVFCKLDASFAPVKVGDLLTTSPSEGYAMRASDQVAAVGAVIGKALAPLQAGQGLVPVLVALQ
jgi:hypothetical protein